MAVGDTDGYADRTLGVVVVAFQSAATLGGLLTSLPDDAIVIVVDNASDTATRELSPVSYTHLTLPTIYSV